MPESEDMLGFRGEYSKWPTRTAAHKWTGKRGVLSQKHGGLLASLIIKHEQNVHAAFFTSELLPGAPYHSFLFQQVPLNVLYCIYVCHNVCY